MSLPKLAEHITGNASTIGAIILNVIQADPINKILTVILSALSIVYMLIQIYTALPKLKRVWKNRKTKQNAD